MICIKEIHSKLKRMLIKTSKWESDNFGMIDYSSNDK